MQLDPTDVLDLLEAAGLVEVSGSAHADPVSVRRVAGLLLLELPRRRPTSDHPTA